MRIAVNTRMLLPGQLEGVGYFTEEMCRRLPEELPEAQFLFCFDRPFDARLIDHPRITGAVIWPPARDPILWKIWFDYRLPRVIRDWKADLLFSPDGYASLNTDVPQVMVTHDLAFLHFTDQLPTRVQRYYEKNVPRFIAKSRHVITVSDFVRNDIHCTYDAPLDKLTVVSNGAKPIFKPVDAEKRTAIRRRYADGCTYFFYLGAVHPRKNIQRLIKSYDQFRRRSPERVLLLLGGRLAWQPQEIRFAIQESEFKTDIQFLGYLSEQDAADLMGSCRAMIYPSLSEGFGVPLLEAMHAEVPIITSSTSSMPEVAGAAAIYVNPEIAEEITSAMLTIVSDAKLVDQLVDAGRQQRKQFSWESSANKVGAVIRRVNNA